jgi:SPP1 gp7 family putative phage head morphogenesis protein
MPASITLGALTPEDAVAAFQARGLLRPSFRWQDVWQAEHARAFAVAGVMRLDVLRTIHDQMQDAVANGTGIEEFSKALKRQLVAKGFWGNIEITDPATGEVRKTKFNQQRLQLIFDVNMRQSHAAGRWARAQRSRMPYIAYRTMRDEFVRASHKPWDNVVLPKDHPWWDTHYPPNGWRCRCLAFPLDDSGVQALKASGARVLTEPPATQWVEFANRSTGQTERVPRGINPGFAYNPGKVHVEQGMDRLVTGISSVRPTLPGQHNALDVARKVIARGRSEKAFREFLAKPPDSNVGMPVAAVPGLRGEPVVASVRAADLVRQAQDADYPQPLPVKAAGWAIAQTVVDRGERLDLPGGGVLWWWARGSGLQRRVHVLEVARGQRVWWVRQVAALSVDEAEAKYPPLKGLL